LPDDLANQIAAGEVVERPSSVVKELVENAIDARARRIRVDIEGGGAELVRVADDGCGMSREDAAVAVLRHATSKIERLDDLRCIRSFGFRGEALPSIASVSRFVLRTRRACDDEGTEVRIEGGAPMQISPCGCAAGTIIEVSDLFFNVPARRKFLRAVRTESAQVTEVVQAAALSEPGVTMILSRDGRVVGEWLRAPSREERARDMHAGEVLAACRGERGPLGVEAFLSRPERARPGATGLSIFVNNRPVRDRVLARAVAQAYGSVLEPGQYPLGAVYLDIPHELVDVNVHPQKAEVRFAEGRAAADALTKILGGELASAFGLPPPGQSPWANRRKLFEDAAPPPLASWVGSGQVPAHREAFAQPPAYPEELGSAPAPDPWGLAGDWPASSAPPAATENKNWRTDSGSRLNADAPAMEAGAAADMPAGRSGAAAGPASAPPLSAPSAAAADAGAASERPIAFRALRFAAQVRKTFLVCEGPDGLYILDQHAAAERVTFHRLRRAYESRDVATQALLFPTVIAVSPSEAALVEEAQDAILGAGLDVRVAGTTSVAVHAVPRLLPNASPERLVRDLLAEIGRSGGRAFSGAIDLALATMACHGSVRAGDPMAPEEVTALLAALDEVEFAGHCPHGRPVVMRIRWPELEHRVGRR
jgi:DNA mismatch repair protein MutL